MSREPKYLPTGRPIAEPPILDYEKLPEDKIPSERRLRRLFARDIAMGYRWRDIITELALLTEYYNWTRDLSTSGNCTKRRHWYFRLCYDTLEKYIKCHFGDEDPGVIPGQALERGITTTLRMWEYVQLDADGGTTKIERLLHDDTKAPRYRADIFEDNEEVIEKYGHLASSDVYAELNEYWGLEEWHKIVSRTTTDNPKT